MKTLKDIKFKSHIRDYVYIDVLKEEVIKRIKVWELQKIKFKKVGNETGVNCVRQIQQEFIEFFNVTENDLK